MLRRNRRLSSTAKLILRAIVVSMLLNGLWSVPHPCKAFAAELTVFNVGILATRGGAIPLWMGQAAGLWAQRGLRLQDIYIEGGTRGIQVLLSGEIQALVTGLGPLLQANSRGADLRVITSTANAVPFIFFSARDVKSAADLKGATIGVSRFGSESDIAVTLALKQLGLTRKEVNVTQIGGNSVRLAALMSGAIKGSPLVEPQISAAREQGLNPLVDFASANVPWIFDAMVVKRNFLESRRELVSQFLRAFIESAYLAVANENMAKRVIGSKLKTADARLVNATYNEFKRLMTLDPEPPRAGAENTIENLQAIGISIPNQNLEDHLDSRIVQTLKKEGFLAELARKYKLP
jgi:ABC-type nitrate/sulfonate/bicarbonate transport system substrate-binding protein